MIESNIIILLNIFGFSIVLFVTFLKGLLIGKAIPTMTFVSIYLLLLSQKTIIDIMSVTLFTALSVTIGELIVYRKLKNTNVQIQDYYPVKQKNKYTNKIRNSSIYNKIQSVFNNKTGIIIFMTNSMYGLNGLSSIPASKYNYDVKKFLIIAYTATFIHQTIVVFIIITGINFIFL